MEPLLLESPGPGYQQVPDGPEVGDPGPLDLAEAAWMFDPDDPDPVQAVLLRLGYRTGHMRLWLDPAARRASGTLVMSFSNRVDAPADQAKLRQQAGAGGGELFDTPSIPGGAGVENADGVTVQYALGSHFASVFTSPGGPEGRAVALDLASRQRTRLPAPPRTTVADGDAAAYAIGEAIGRGAVIGVPVVLVVAAVVTAVTRRRRRAGVPAGPPPHPAPWAAVPGAVPPGPASPIARGPAPPPVEAPAAVEVPPPAAVAVPPRAVHVPAVPLRPAARPAPPRRRQPTGAGPRRRGSPVI